MFNLEQSAAISPLYCPGNNFTGVRMDRNFKASLSPSELASLCGLRMNEKRQIPASHRQSLLSMGLIVVAGEDLILTETGSQRVNHEERGHAWTVTQEG